MAGWDKIRAAAQRPDCILGLFPDGDSDTGMMYHPRRSSNEYVAIQNNRGGTAEVVDGEFFTSSGQYYAGFNLEASVFHICECRQITIMTKFMLAQLPETGRILSYTPISMTGIASGAYCGFGHYVTYSGNSNQIRLNSGGYYMADGTRTTIGNLGYVVFEPYIWHTAAYKIDYDNYQAAWFFDGKKIKEMQFTNTTAYAEPLAGNACFCYAHGTANVADIPEVQMKSQYGLWFNRYLSDEEILYLMEE